MLVTAATCAPARAELNTGLFPQRNGVFRNHLATNSDQRSAVHHLSDLGYRVGLLVERIQFYPAVQLLDLEQDPWQMDNLADTPESPPTVQAIKTAITDRMQQQSDDGNLAGKRLMCSNMPFPQSRRGAG